MSSCRHRRGRQGPWLWPLGRHCLGLAVALGALGGCTPFPGVRVAFSLPNDSPLSTLVRDQWMNPDRLLAEQVRQLLRERLGDTVRPLSRADLEAAGMHCEPAPSQACSHRSEIRRTPLGPVPASGAGTRTVTVQVLAQTGAPVEAVQVLKTQD